MSYMSQIFHKLDILPGGHARK